MHETFEFVPGTQGAEGNRKPGETGADRKVWELSEGIPGQSLTWQEAGFLG